MHISRITVTITLCGLLLVVCLAFRLGNRLKLIRGEAHVRGEFKRLDATDTYQGWMKKVRWSGIFLCGYD